MSVDDSKSNWRVKLYQLEEEGAWKDRGTGNVCIKHVEGFGGPCIIVEDENSDETLLQVKVHHEDIYERQNENIILWREYHGDVGFLDLALSFRDSSCCQMAWTMICEAQDDYHRREYLNEMAEESSLNLRSNGRFGGAADASGTGLENRGGQVFLPQCSLDALPEIRHKLMAASYRQKDEYAELVMEKDCIFLWQLISLTSDAEDLEDYESLQRIADIWRALMQLNNSALLEVILTEDIFGNMLGAMEYDVGGSTTSLTGCDVASSVAPIHDGEASQNNETIFDVSSEEAGSESVVTVKAVSDVAVSSEVSASEALVTSLNALTPPSPTARPPPPGTGINYREFFSTQVHMKQVAREHGKEVKEAAAKLYRLQFLRDQILRPFNILDEGGVPAAAGSGTALSSMVTMTSAQLCSLILEDKEYMSALIDVVNSDEHTEPGVSDSDIRTSGVSMRRGDGIRFLRELFILTRSMTLDRREVYYNSFISQYKEKFFPAVSKILLRSRCDSVTADEERVLISEVLAILSVIAPSGVRKYVLEGPVPVQSSAKVIASSSSVIGNASSTSSNNRGSHYNYEETDVDSVNVDVQVRLRNEQCFLYLLLRTIVEDTEAVVIENIDDVVCVLLDMDRMDKHEKEAFLGAFYDFYLQWLLTPFIEPNIPDQFSTERGALINVENSSNVASTRLHQDISAVSASRKAIFDILCTCVHSHSYRMKYFIMRNNVLARCLRILDSRYRHLHLGVLRLIRVIISLKEDFYLRHIVKFDLLKPVFKLLKSTARKDNLVTSTIVDLIEVIRGENIRILVSYVVEKHADAFDELMHVDTFDKLRIRYDQNLEADQEKERGATSSSGAGGALEQQRQQRNKNLVEREREDAYFLDDDDDDDNRNELPPVHRNNNGSSGSTRAAATAVSIPTARPYGPLSPPNAMLFGETMPATASRTLKTSGYFASLREVFIDGELPAPKPQRRQEALERSNSLVMLECYGDDSDDESDEKRRDVRGDAEKRGMSSSAGGVSGSKRSRSDSSDSDSSGGSDTSGYHLNSSYDNNSNSSGSGGTGDSPGCSSTQQLRRQRLTMKSPEGCGNHVGSIMPDRRSLTDGSFSVSAARSVGAALSVVPLVGETSVSPAAIITEAAAIRDESETINQSIPDLPPLKPKFEGDEDEPIAFLSKDNKAGVHKFVAGGMHHNGKAGSSVNQHRMQINISKTKHTTAEN